MGFAPRIEAKIVLYRLVDISNDKSRGAFWDEESSV
jgi:hypothetical protein